MYAVFFEGVRIHEAVVDVGSAEVIEVIAQYVVDEVLEGNWGIGEAESHYCVLVMPKSCPKCVFPFLTFCHGH